MKEESDNYITLPKLVLGGLVLAKLTGKTTLSWFSIFFIPFLVYVIKIVIVFVGLILLIYLDSYRAGGAFMENLSIPSRYLKPNDDQTFIQYVFNQPPKSDCNFRMNEEKCMVYLRKDK